ncbi:MAG: hypothetical protein M3548_06800 [Actinomycetota bacterium]|nr:hypothetical protein [Actinomycetota bacterium]
MVSAWSRVSLAGVFAELASVRLVARLLGGFGGAAVPPSAMLVRYRPLGLTECQA